MKKALLFLTVYMLFAAFPVNSWYSQLFPFSAGSYNAATVSFNARNWRLNDYSYVGYNLGETPMQTGIPCNVLTISGTGDISQELQDKINTVGAAGGGIVKIPAGTYTITQTSAGKTIGINYNNVSVEGAGSGYTIINVPATHSYNEDANAFEGTFSIEKGYFAWNKGWSDPSTTLCTVNNAINEGDTYITGLSNLGAVSAGSWVLIIQYFWAAIVANNGGTGTWSVCAGNCTGNPQREFAFSYLRKVVSKDASGITIDAPIPHALNPANNPINIKDPGVASNMIQNCGVSGMAIQFADNNNSTTQNLPSGCAVYFEGALNCWVKDVLIKNFPRYGICVEYSARVTVADTCTQKAQNFGGGGNGYAFFNTCSQNTLYKNCTGITARHNFIVSRAISSYVVMAHCRSIESVEGEDTHYSLAHAILRDDYYQSNGNDLNGYNRGSTSGGAYESYLSGALWNCAGDGYGGIYYGGTINITPSSDGSAIIIGGPDKHTVYDGTYYDAGGNYHPGDIMPANAGLQVGPGPNGTRKNVLYEGLGSAGLQPQSLYEEQLKNRVGVVALWANVCADAPTFTPVPTNTPVLTPGILVYDSDHPAWGAGPGSGAPTMLNTLTPGNNQFDKGQNRTINGTQSIRYTAAGSDWAIMTQFSGPNILASGMNRLDFWVFPTAVNLNFRVQLLNFAAGVPTSLATSVIVSGALADGGAFTVNTWNHVAIPMASFGYAGTFNGVDIRVNVNTANNTFWLDDIYFIPNVLATATNTPVLTATFTRTRPQTPTNTPSIVPSPTVSPSRTVTFSATSTRTATPSFTFTQTYTVTATRTNTLGNTNTNTPTCTFTFTRTPSPTFTRTPTPPPTFTFTVLSTPTFTATVAGKWGACGKVLLAYYYNDGTNPYNSSKIPYDKLTHICHAFVVPNADGSLNVPAGFLEPALIANAHTAGDKVLISTGGGGTYAAYAAMAGNAATRNTFENNMVAFIQANGYDGIDIDWEGMANATDRTNYTSLITELRTKFNASQPPANPWLITAAVPMTNWGGQWIDYPSILSSVDFFNVMTYDMHGSWSNDAGENAALYTNPSDPDAISDVAGVDYMTVTRGVPASKVVMGVPFYGYDFSTVESLFGACGAPNCGGASGNDTIYLNYKVVVTTYLGNGWTYNWDAVSHVPYLTNDSGPGVITYDNPQSIADKVNYAITTRNLKGVMMWDLSGDYIPWQGQPLMDAMYSTFMAACPSGFTATPTFTITPTYTATPVWASLIIYDGDTAGARITDGVVTNSANGGGLTQVTGGNGGNGMLVTYVDSTWYSSHTWQLNTPKNIAGYNYLQFDVKAVSGFVDSFNFLMDWTKGAVNISNYSPIGIPPYWITIQIPLSDLLMPADTQVTFFAFQKLVNYPYTLMLDNIKLVNIATPTNTPVVSATFTRTRTPTITSTMTITRTNTATQTFTPSASSSVTNTGTRTITPAGSPTNTPVMTQTFTVTPSLTMTRSVTQSVTPTCSPTSTRTATLTHTASPNYSPTQTVTGTPPTYTNTPTVTATPTGTLVPTGSFTPTFTRTVSVTPTLTGTPPAAPTFTATPPMPTPTNTVIPEGQAPEIKDVVIYPNPLVAGGVLSIKLNLSQTPENITLKIYTVSFRAVREVTWDTGIHIGDNTLQANAAEIASLSSGVYYYVIKAKSFSSGEARAKAGILVVFH